MNDVTSQADVRTLPAQRGGPDGGEVADGFAGHLDYLSRLARDLGVSDPVEEYFSPVVGRWSDLHAEADRWRLVGDAAQDVTESLNKPLGGLDAAWDGAAADSFIEYMQKFGLAGQDLSDAMLGIADVLDITAEGIREVVMQLATVLGETAESASEAMVMPVQGDERTRQYLDMMRRPTKELFEAVRQILEAFVRLCEGIDGAQAFEQITMAHTFPENNWSFESPAPPEVPKPAEPAETSKAEIGGLGGGGGVGAGGGGFGGGGAAAAGVPAPSGPGGFTYATEQPPPAPKPETGAAAASSGGGGGRGGMGGGMMPMMGGMGMGGQGTGGDHKSRVRVIADPTEVFGEPQKASAPIIGDDD
ncbi:WXG100 family type VII secretion target [Actinophytocola sediminis]